MPYQMSDQITKKTEVDIPFVPSSNTASNGLSLTHAATKASKVKKTFQPNNDINPYLKLSFIKH